MLGATWVESHSISLTKDLTPSLKMVAYTYIPTGRLFISHTCVRPWGWLRIQLFCTLEEVSSFAAENHYNHAGKHTHIVYHKKTCNNDVMIIAPTEQPNIAFQRWLNYISTTCFQYKSYSILLKHFALPYFLKQKK